MPPRVTRSALLHRGRVFELRRETIAFDDGPAVDMDIIRHPGAAAMVPITSEKAVVLVRQYRPALRDTIWEIPAGTRDPAETPLACAKRELVEETGFSADQWHELGAITPLPGYADERIHIFLATQLLPAAQSLDDDERLTVHRIPWDVALEMIHKGTIQDGKTIAGLFMAAHWLASSATACEK